MLEFFWEWWWAAIRGYPRIDYNQRSFVLQNIFSYLRDYSMFFLYVYDFMKTEVIMIVLEFTYQTWWMLTILAVSGNFPIE